MAEIEWITGVLRAGKDFHKYGDPYQFSATLIVDGDQAVLKGATGQMDRQTWQEIACCLAQQGISSVAWKRADGSITSVHTKTECERR